jgi:hypothetical protein
MRMPLAMVSSDRANSAINVLISEIIIFIVFLNIPLGQKDMRNSQGAGK